MRICENGSVGIGLSSPSTKLHVYLGTSTTGIRVKGYNNQEWDMGIIGVNPGPGGCFQICDITNGFIPFKIESGASEDCIRISGGNVGIGCTNPNTKLKCAETKLISGTVTDGFSAGLTLTPTYTALAAQTVTRHNYIDVNNAATTNVTITDAAVMRFDAAAGTHKAVDSGTTKSSPGTVGAWLKININGTLYYLPAYSSKTA
jgi:hypothetical protein